MMTPTDSRQPGPEQRGRSDSVASGYSDLSDGAGSVAASEGGGGGVSARRKAKAKQTFSTKPSASTRKPPRR